MHQRAKARTGGLYLVLKTLKLSRESFQFSFQFSDGLFRRFTCKRNTCDLRSGQSLVSDALSARAETRPKEFCPNRLLRPTQGQFDDRDERVEWLRCIERARWRDLLCGIIRRPDWWLLRCAGAWLPDLAQLARMPQPASP